MTSMHRRMVSGTIKAMRATVGHHVRGGGSVTPAIASSGGDREPLRRDAGDIPHPSGRAHGVTWQTSGWRTAGGGARDAWGDVRSPWAGAPRAARPLRSSIGQDLLAYLKAFGAYR